MTLKTCGKLARKELEKTGSGFIWICYSESKGYYFHHPITSENWKKPDNAVYVLEKGGILNEVK